jgi:hypothetical protein
LDQEELLSWNCSTVESWNWATKARLSCLPSIGSPSLRRQQEYWRSFDQLESFAKNPDRLHLPAWIAFSERVGCSDDVGVYHETYGVDAGQFESTYVNLPVIGLSPVGSSVAVGEQSDTSRARRSE